MMKFNMTNLNTAIIPEGMNLRALWPRTPMIMASIPLDANIYNHTVALFGSVRIGLGHNTMKY